MIVWWTGRGWLAFVIPIGFFILGIFGSQALVDRFPRQLPVSLPCSGALIGLTIGGFACWILGRCWNRDVTPYPGRTRVQVIREYIEDADHKLYGLPMEYWGMLAVLFSMLVEGMLVARWLSEILG